MHLGAHVAALGFRFTRATTRYSFEPQDALSKMAELGPLIATTWHGQHFMIHVARPSKRPFSVMISRHRDGELNALVAQKLGANIIRGSGGARQDMHRKGAVSASREVLRALPGASEALIDQYIAQRELARTAKLPLPQFAPAAPYSSFANGIVVVRAVARGGEGNEGASFAREAVVMRLATPKRPYTFLRWKEFSAALPISEAAGVGPTTPALPQ